MLTSKLRKITTYRKIEFALSKAKNKKRLNTFHYATLIGYLRKK